MIADPQALVKSIREEVAVRRREIEDLERERLAEERRVPAGNEPQHLSLPGDEFERLCLQAADPPAQPHLHHLLAYYDRRFVDLAYRRILKRPMDAEGEWFLEQLRSGTSRVEILVRLRGGPDGKRQRTPLPGLAWHRLAYKVRRLRVIGWIYRILSYVASWLWCLLTLPRLAADAERWRQHTMALFTGVEENLNRNYACLEDSLDKCVTRDQLADLRKQLEQRLAELEFPIDDQTRQDANGRIMGTES